MRKRAVSPAILASAAVILLSPWIGEARSWLRRAIPGEFSLVLNIGLAAIAVGALVVAVHRIRTRRIVSYAMLLAAAVVALTFAWATASPSAAQNAVERFHFVEYGAVTALFYRAWRDRGDLSVILLPVVAGLLVGTADEAWQWFVPERVGEWRDIFINLGAIVSGLLFSLAIAPPASFAPAAKAASRRLLATMSAALVLALAAFLQLVHLGYLNTDDEIGSFRSRYTRDELLALARDRAARWPASPPPMTIQRFSREDQYLAEALWHVRARNEAWGADVTRAWQENRLLEKYFAPCLDVRSYLTPAGVRWPDAQRADAETRRNAGATALVSHAEPDGFILTWSRSALWAGALALAGVLLAVAWPRAGAL